MIMKKIYAFDFDGTLTTQDTLLAFIKFVHGKRKLYAGLLLFAPLLLLMKLKLYSNAKAKERVLCYFFSGMPLKLFREACHNFAITHQYLLRPQGMQLIKECLLYADEVVIVSASVEDWMKPFFEKLPKVHVVGTKIGVSNGYVTGKLVSPNCYGKEKVRRMQELYPNRKTYFLSAYGDSRGDKELLAYADEKHYRPFSKADSKWGEVLRFGIVGSLAVLIQYAAYLLLLSPLQKQLAMTIAYFVSFCFNYLASSYFTFRVSVNIRRSIGFAISHVVNYCLQMLFLNLFVVVGIHQRYAPVPMFCVCVPINFILVRHFLKHKVSE